jgi:hypothetical protein
VLNAKGGEIKAKATGSAIHLRIFKNRRARNLFLSKYSYCKIWSLVGRILIMGKRGVLALEKFYS